MQPNERVTLLNAESDGKRRRGVSHGVRLCGRRKRFGRRKNALMSRGSTVRRQKCEWIPYVYIPLQMGNMSLCQQIFPASRVDDEGFGSMKTVGPIDSNAARRLRDAAAHMVVFQNREPTPRQERRLLLGDSDAARLERHLQCRLRPRGQ